MRHAGCAALHPDPGPSHVLPSPSLALLVSPSSHPSTPPLARPPLTRRSLPLHHRRDSSDCTVHHHRPLLAHAQPPLLTSHLTHSLTASIAHNLPACPCRCSAHSPHSSRVLRPDARHPAGRPVVQPSPSPLSLQQLQLLPPALFSLITQLLPLPDNLLHLTHVSHTFTPLAPMSLARDTLTWTPAVIARLTASPPSPLLSLLSLAPSAIFFNVRHSLAALCRLLPSDCSPSPLSALRSAFFEPSVSNAKEKDEGVLSLVSSLRFCPQLISLELRLNSGPPNSLAPSLSPLPQLPSLHTLRITAELTQHDPPPPPLHPPPLSRSS